MKQTLTLIATLILLPSVHVQAKTNLPEQLAACGKIANNNHRLACYDRLTSTVASTPRQPTQQVVKSHTDNNTSNNKPSPVTSSGAVATTTPTTTATKEENFGLKEKTPDVRQRIPFTVTKAKTDRYGKLLLTFSNGQKWLQTDTRTRRTFTGPVTIEEGLLGSFMLYKKGSTSGMRVKRIK